MRGEPPEIHVSKSPSPGLCRRARPHCPGDVYNICSGQGYSLREVLTTYKNLTNVEIKERVDPSRFRRIDEAVKVGDCTKIRALGWSVKRPIPEVLKEILEYWRIWP